MSRSKLPTLLIERRAKSAQDLAEALQFPKELTQDRRLLAQYLSGNKLFPGSEPIAMAYAIERHYPELADFGDTADRYIALLDKVIEKQITLVVNWMRVTFIHGVMNTDNTAISGETIDYGPCAMMSVYDHHLEAVLQECLETVESESAERFLSVLRSPYDELPDTSLFQDPPHDGDKNYRTFCGT